MKVASDTQNEQNKKIGKTSSYKNPSFKSYMRIPTYHSKSLQQLSV